MSIPAVVKRWIVFALGLSLVMVGAVIVSQPITYGWFGSPDGSFTRFPSAVVTVPTGGALALAAGIILVAGSLGYVLGSRSRRER